MTDYNDNDLVEDPAALEAAEREVAQQESADFSADFDDTWVIVFGPAQLGGLLSADGATGFTVTGPLSAAGIPFVWDPMSPEHQQRIRPDFNWNQRFTLYVPADAAEEARAILEELDLVE